MKRSTLLLAMVPMLPAASLGAQGQVASDPPVEPTYDFAAPVPFGPGESLEYQVKVGMFGVGSGHMHVFGVQDVRGHPSYHVQMGIDGGLAFAKVRDVFQSWIDVRNLVSRRFIKDQQEVGYEKYQHFEFFPEERRFERGDNEETGDLPTSLPLDDISFVYFVRSLPLDVGKEYTFHRYFEEDGNPVKIRVLRKDTVEVPAGQFNTIVVQPIIRTSGLWSEGGEAEIHFSDDANRYVVYMKADIPNFPGSLSLHLRGIEAGTSLRPVEQRGDRP